MPNITHINLDTETHVPPKVVALIRLRETKRLTGLSTSAIYPLIAEGRFPRQVSLGTPRRIAFVESEIAAWIQKRIAERDSVGRDYPDC